MDPGPTQFKNSSAQLNSSLSGGHKFFDLWLEEINRKHEQIDCSLSRVNSFSGISEIIK